MSTNNSINTPLITLGGTLTTSGANPVTFTTTGSTNVTLPTSGILATTADLGVLSAQGTNHQVLVSGTFGSPQDGAVILTTPQDIDITSSPTFANLAVSNAALFGTTTSTSGFGNVQSVEISASSMISSLCYSATTGQTGQFISAHSLSTTIGIFSAVGVNTALGSWQSYGDDGTQFTISSQINTAVDNTVSTGIVPGRIEFRTANASGVLTRGLTLDSNQILTADKQIIAQSFSPSTTAGIIGTTTNDNAAAGSVGEFISASTSFGSPVSLTTGTAADVCSISLTAGDWDVWGNVGFLGNVLTLVQYEFGWTSQTSATAPTADFLSSQVFTAAGVAIFAAGNSIFNVQQQRISLSGTTTIYLSAQAAFSVSTCSAFGNLKARRVR